MERLRDGENSTVVEMTAEAILKLKLLPRAMMIAMTIMSWRVVEWFMSLPDPTPSQAGLVSVVTGAMTGAFAVWMNHEGKSHATGTDRSSDRASREVHRGQGPEKQARP